MMANDREAWRAAASFASLLGTVLACAWASAPAWGSPGQPDPSFGTGGVAAYDLSYGSNRGGSKFYVLAPAPHGELDLAGVSSDSGGGFRVLAARMSETGVLDPSFGTGGWVRTTYGPPPDYLVGYSGDSELVESDGSMIVGGQPGVTELGPSGQPNPDFYAEADNQANSLVRLPNGDILTAGRWNGEDLDPNPATLERRLPNGEPDPKFGRDGLVQLPTHPGEGVVEDAQDVLLLADGDVIVGGTGHYRAGNSGSIPFLWLMRCNSDGTLDSSFAENGIRYVEGVAPAIGDGDRESAVVSQPDGRLILLGTASETRGQPYAHMSAWAFTAEGDADSSFGEDGVATIPSSDPGTVAHLTAAAVDAEGGILVAGNQRPAEGEGTLPMVARLDPSGGLDHGYGDDGFAIGPPDARFEAIAVDAQDRAIVAGYREAERPVSPGIPYEEALVARFLGPGGPAAPETAATTPAGTGAGSAASTPASAPTSSPTNPPAQAFPVNPAAPAKPPACVVPALTGHRLAGARRLLLRAHCRLGHVATPPEHALVLVVEAQAIRPDRRLAHGAAIAVRLGPGRRH